jgi:hypothetical protein
MAIISSLAFIFIVYSCGSRRLGKHSLGYSSLALQDEFCYRLGDTYGKTSTQVRKPHEQYHSE